jgi:succinoglycan biosynthesis protein ExoO
MGFGARVSVVIPVYDSAPTLRRAVGSVLCQTLRDLELLIVDDGSRDTSLALARQLADSDERIRVIALPENRGKSHAMNRAIAEATGTWSAVLDADDWYEPERLAVLVSAGDRAEVHLVADNQRFHDAAAGIEVGLAFPAGDEDIELTRGVFIAGSDPYAAFNLGMLKPVVRTDFIRTYGLAYRENARLSEDFLYLVEFFAAGGAARIVPRPMYNWTQPFGSIARQWTTTGFGPWRYDFRAALAANEDVLQGLRRRGDHALAALLASRMRAFRKLHHLSEVNRLRATGSGVARIAAAIARHPSIWPRLLGRVSRSVRGDRVNISQRSPGTGTEINGYLEPSGNRRIKV